MARRRESLIGTLGVLPWWVSTMVAGIAYALLAVVAPYYFAGHRLTAGIGIVAKNHALLVAGCFLAVGAVSFLRSFFIGRTFDGIVRIEHLRRLPWRAFESMVAEAFRRRGFAVLENAANGPDGGIDLVLGKGGATFYVQCKHWKQTKVGVKPVREFYGVIAAGAAEGGFFVASGAYTQEAQEFARTCTIELIDGPALVGMIAKTRTAESIVDSIDHKRTVPPLESSMASSECPACGAAMVRRTAARGKHAGQAFWGCSAYPRCREIKPI